MMQGCPILFIISEIHVFVTEITDVNTPRQWAIEAFGNDKERKKAKAKSGEVLRRLGKADMQLDEYERMCSPFSPARHMPTEHRYPTEIIAAEVIHPDDIDVKFNGEGAH